MTMLSTNLGKLEQVDLRDVWENEAQSFTPWLAAEENLALLGETIGIDLELEAQEKDVGPFRADLLCKDTATGDWVLIENQLERTDHSHLGQLLTYAAGLQAVTIVWVAHRFTEEHRATHDWLNEITDERFSFFGLEIELWRIGTSPIAPKFNMVYKPNDWSKAISRTKQNAAELSDAGRIRLSFWTKFNEYLAESKTFLKPHSPRPDSFTSFGIGKSYFWTHAHISPQKRRMGVGVAIGGPNAKANFRILKSQQAEIENITGPMEWDEAPDKTISNLWIRATFDPVDQDKWQEHFAWLRQKLEVLDRAFRSRVKALNTIEVVVDPSAMAL